MVAPSLVSSLLQCSAHGQTLQMVRARWDEIAAADEEQDKVKRAELKAKYVDLTFCFCCTGPAKYPGIDAMTMHEIELITPLCSRCDPNKESATVGKQRKEAAL